MKLMHKIYKIISYVLIPIIKINTFIRIIKKKEDKIGLKKDLVLPIYKNLWEKNLFGFMPLVLESLNLVIL